MTSSINTKTITEATQNKNLNLENCIAFFVQGSPGSTYLVTANGAGNGIRLESGQSYESRLPAGTTFGKREYITIAPISASVEVTIQYITIEKKKE